MTSGKRPRHDAGEAWPELPWHEWEPTMTTLHLWTQIVGKVRLALTPPLNHWWHSALYTTARGLTTTPIAYEQRHFQADFDFVDHRLVVADSDGGLFSLDLPPKSVAQFYREFMDGMNGLGIDVRIGGKPAGAQEAIPFESDEVHASYDRVHAQRFWHALLQADRVMKQFAGGFVGKQSPVQFFWGSFDLALTRFSGRRARVTDEADADEQISVGWWPSSRDFGPAFYAYTKPAPEGFREAPIQPPAARFDEQLGEFILTWDDVRRSPGPDRLVLDFFESTYDAGARLAGWDRASLERPT